MKRGGKGCLIALLLLGLPVFLLSFLLGYSNANTRSSQEAAFFDAFDFRPPQSVEKISSTVLSTFLGEGRWICCTYEESVFARILKGNPYHAPRPQAAYLLTREEAPPWWPKNVDQNSIQLFCYDSGDTPKDEGFSMETILWHDGKYIYWHQLFWD